MLNHWIKDQVCFGTLVNNITTVELNVKVLDTYIMIRQDKQEDKKKVELPAKFDPNHYNLLKTSLNSYLNNKIGQGGAPLSYLLHDDTLHPAQTATITSIGTLL